MIVDCIYLILLSCVFARPLTRFIRATLVKTREAWENMEPSTAGFTGWLRQSEGEPRPHIYWSSS